MLHRTCTCVQKRQLFMLRDSTRIMITYYMRVMHYLAFEVLSKNFSFNELYMAYMILKNYLTYAAP